MTTIAVVIGSTTSEMGSGAAALSTSDRGAIAIALRQAAADVRAVALDEDARCYARAAGIELVETPSGSEIGEFELALIGRGGCGESGDALPARLAEAARAALVFEVIDVEWGSDRILVTRDRGRGARDVLEIRGRAILVVADSVPRGRYVSRHRMHAEKIAAGATPSRSETESGEWQRIAPRVRLGDHASRVAGRAVDRMNALFGVGESAASAVSLARGSAQDCARHLLRYLGHHGFVERGRGGEPAGAFEDIGVPQSSQRRAVRRAEGFRSVSNRVRRRPHALGRDSLAARGPYEAGVDI